MDKRLTTILSDMKGNTQCIVKNARWLLTTDYWESWDETALNTLVYAKRVIIAPENFHTSEASQNRQRKSSKMIVEDFGIAQSVSVV